MPKEVVTWTISATVPGETYRAKLEALARMEEQIRITMIEIEKMGFTDIYGDHDVERLPTPMAKKAVAPVEGETPRFDIEAQVRELGADSLLPHDAAPGRRHKAA
jgi:hypothetical protein